MTCMTQTIGGGFVGRIACGLALWGVVCMAGAQTLTIEQGVIEQAEQGQAEVVGGMAALLARVPAGSVAVLTWKGFDEAEPAFAQSRFKAMLDETGLVARGEKVLGALLKQVPENNLDNALRAEALRDLGPAMWRRPWVVYFEGVDFVEVVPRGVGGMIAREPAFSAGLLIQAGEDAQVFRAWLEREVRKAQENPEFQHLDVTLVDEDGLLGIRLHERGRDADMAALAGDAHYAQAFADRGHSGHVGLYVDLSALRSLIHEGIAFEEGDEEAEEFDRVIKTTGLNGLGRLAWSGGFVERDWQSEVWLETVGPRVGLLKLLDQEALPADVLKLTTTGSPWARAMRLDVGGAFDVLIEVLDEAGDGRALEDIGEGLAEFRAELGFDLREDLLGSLGATWLVYTDASFGGMYGSGLAVVSDGLADAEKLEEVLLGLQASFNAAMDEGGGMPFRFVEMDLGEAVVQTMPLPMFSPSWTVRDGRWFFANSPQSVLTAVGAAKDQEGSIERSKTFTEISPALGVPADAKRTGVMVLNPRKTAITTYQSVNMIVAMVGGELERETGIDLGEAIPPLSTITPHLSAAGGVSWVDGSGYHSRMRTPFPGATMLSPDAMIGGSPVVAAAMVGVSLPAVGGSRQAARRAQGMSHARQISIGMLAYAAGHRDQFPMTLEELVADNYLPGDGPEVLRHPLDKGPAGASSFLLILPGARQDEMERPARTVALIGRADFDGDGMVTVGYADGHVSMVDLTTLSDTLTEQTGRSYEQWVGQDQELN